ncbi:oxidoreductase [Neisseria meningitidis]|nr:oxidoreductase [Neisseria meningitidis]
MTRIAILGGGLSGRLTALQLAEQGYQIALFDKGCRRGEHAAAYVAAAMLAPAAEAVKPRLKWSGWAGRASRFGAASDAV